MQTVPCRALAIEGAEICVLPTPRSEEHATGNPSGMDEREDGYAHTEERPGTIASSVTMGTSSGTNTERDTARPILLRAQDVKRPCHSPVLVVREVVLARSGGRRPELLDAIEEVCVRLRACCREARPGAREA